MKTSYFLILAFLAGFLNGYAQDDRKTPEDYIISRTIDKNGNEIVGVIVPGKPPDHHREPVAAPSRSTVSLANVPAFDWSFGCSATSAAMAAGYYDNNGYADMYTGPTNGGIMPMDNSIWGYVVINGQYRAQCPLSATRNTVDGRTTNGHVDDYWVIYGSSADDPYITNGWTEHTYDDCTGDFMGTNQSELGCSDGATIFYMDPSGSPLYNFTGGEPGHIDGCHGLRDFYESRGYDVISNYSQYIYGFNGNTLGFTFDQYRNEINNGRPVLIQVAGHTMLGYGYDDTGNTVYLHDTWDYSNHSMTWGGSYSGMVHYGVCVVQLEPGSYYPTASFSASTTTTLPGNSVSFTDLSIGSPVSWSWVFSPNTVTYLGGSTSASQHPQVSFNNSGYYTVSLTVTNANGSDTEIKTNYIHAFVPGLWTGAASTDWNTASNWDEGVVPGGTTNVTISPTALNEPSFTGDFTVGTQCGSLTIPAGTLMEISGNFTINAGKSLTFAGNGELDISGNWTNNGTFTPGTGTVTFSGTNPSLVSNNGTLSDITSYQRSIIPKSITFLTDSLPGPGGDDGNGDVPIGFTFNYSGQGYTQAHICTNGWISLNAIDGSAANNKLFSMDAPNSVLAPWWDDLEDDGTSFVSYKTEGSTPYCVFTVEWYRVLSYTSGASARITFQVKLYESTNNIEFHYGDVNSGTHSGSETASIGIEDATGGPNHFIEATTGSTTTGVNNLKSLTNWPTVNYRFSPPPTVENFYNLNINKNGTQVSFSCNVNVAGTLTINPAANLKVNYPRSMTLNGTGE